MLSVGAALAAPAAAREVPYLTGRIMDQAGMIPDEVEARIEAKLATLESETGSQVAVLTLPSLEGDPLEDFSIRVVDTWRLGREGIDDGVLLLVAQQERQMRIEVGYGLEGALTDARSRRILDHVIAPRFREGDFGGGIEAGVDAILAVIRGEELPAPAAPRARPIPCGALLLFLFLLILLAILVAVVTRHVGVERGWSSSRGWGPIVVPSGRGGGWSGGSGGGRGGGFSGGGGGFGGGGASGRW